MPASCSRRARSSATRCRIISSTLVIWTRPSLTGCVEVLIPSPSFQENSSLPLEDLHKIGCQAHVEMLKNPHILCPMRVHSSVICSERRNLTVQERSALLERGASCQNSVTYKQISQSSVISDRAAAERATQRGCGLLEFRKASGPCLFPTGNGGGQAGSFPAPTVRARLLY